MKKFILYATFFIASICFALVGDMNVYAEDIVVDGQYDDWNIAEMDSIDSLFFSKVKMVIADDALYIYAKENGINSWENYFSYAAPKLITSEGKQISLVFTSGDSVDGCSQIIVRDSQWRELTEIKTVRTKEDTYCFEMMIPISHYGDIDAVSMMVDYSTSMEFKPSVSGEAVNQEDTTEAESETESSTVENITGTDFGIIIDGLFEDWEAYPHVLDTNWNMPEEQRTEQNCHTLGLYSDGEYMYIHTKMLSGWDFPLNTNFFELIAGDKEVIIYLYTQDGTDFLEADLGEGTHSLILQYINGTNNMSDRTVVQGAEASFVRKNGQPDEIEVKIPLNVFEKVHGMSVSDIKTIRVKNPNLYDKGVTVAGSSSAPLLGVAVCILSVAGGTAVYKKKKHA